jgi:hypothetical protein
MQKHIGPYQRPAPSKTGLGLSAPKTAQKSAVPMHEIEAQAQVLLQGMIQKARKPGRPAVHQGRMNGGKKATTPSGQGSCEWCTQARHRPDV